MLRRRFGLFKLYKAVKESENDETKRTKLFNKAKIGMTDFDDKTTVKNTNVS